MMISPEQLRRFSLFAGLDPGVFKSLSMMADEVSVSEGEWLFHEGEEADSLYLILKGTVELKLNLDEQGTRQADLETLVEGDTVGWSALVEPHIYGLAAVASAETTLVQLDAVKLREWMAENTEQGYVLMHRIAQVIKTRLNNMRVRFVSVTES
jgi:CRP-like cAMP-binding protein